MRLLDNNHGATLRDIFLFGCAIVFILRLQQPTQELGNDQVVDLGRVCITQVNNAHPAWLCETSVVERTCLLIVKNLQADELSQFSLHYPPACRMGKMLQVLPFEDGADQLFLLRKILTREPVLWSSKIIGFLVTGSKFSTDFDHIIHMFQRHPGVAS